MNQSTKKQHYIWRKYLTPWTNNNSTTGQIACLRNGKLFSTSLMNIAHENYFYRVEELSAQEKELLYLFFIEKTDGLKRTMRERMLRLYCMPYDSLNYAVMIYYLFTGKMDRDAIQNNPTFREWEVEHIEGYQGIIESMGTPFIEALQNNDLSFWKKETNRQSFSFYLANQYLRTKNMQVKAMVALECAKNLECFSDIHPEKLWIPVSLILSADLGLHIASKPSAVLLQSEDTPFIVGDQPVINLDATYDLNTMPVDFEAFYPVTPHSALLLSSATNYRNGDIVSVSAEEVKKYNRLEQKASCEYLFAKDQAHLREYVIE